MSNREQRPSERFGLIALWACFIAFDSATQILMKMGASRLHSQPLSIDWLRAIGESPLIWTALVCLIVTFALWLRILAAMGLGMAFATSSLTIIAVLALAWVFLGEPFHVVGYFGAALIVIGVLLLRPLSGTPGAR